MTTPSQEIEILIRARYPILYIVSPEELRVQKCSWRSRSDGRRKYSSGA